MAATAVPAPGSGAWHPEAAGDAPVIVAEGLTKRYGSRTAVRDLTFEVRPGEVFGLLGPNGAGKTTTVLMLLGLTEPTAGRAWVVGVDPTRDPLEVKRRVGYLPDSVGFYDGLTGRANLAYTARLNRLPPREAAARIDALLEQVGLTAVADRRVETYSRGMRQRLGIADALVKDPEVLVLDEPTVSLDPEGVAELLELIGRVAAERGIAILLSSHLLDQVQAVCHRVGIFYDGRLVAEGSIADLAAAGGKPDDLVELEATGPGDLATWLHTAAGVADARPDPAAPGRLLVRVPRGGVAGLAAALAAAGYTPLHLRVREERLDAIYRRLVQAAADEAGDGPGGPAGRAGDAVAEGAVDAAGGRADDTPLDGGDDRVPDVADDDTPANPGGTR